VRLHSNPEAEADDLRRIRSAASSPRPVEGSQQPRQHQRRLSMTEVTMLIKELVQRFGNHRLGGTSVLRRHGVELRRAGIPPEDIQEPISLYGQGSSLARLGDSTTLTPRRSGGHLRPVPGVVMRSPNSGQPNVES
jgi:hypothetical protein